MALPHPLLSLGAAGLCWALAALLAGRGGGPAEPGFLAVPGSALGALIARQMKGSLYSYWHAGESAVALPAPRAAAAPPPPPSGRFMRRAAAAPPPPAPVETGSWLDRRIDRWLALEARRTRRTSSFAPSAAHQRYLNASALWRLRLAHRLDPADPALYEILHTALTAQALDSPRLRGQTQELADQAIARAAGPMAGMLQQLTGAGAAINRLNELMAPEALPRDSAAIRRYLASLQACLVRYHDIRRQAETEGWWAGLSAIRQEEIESHARLLDGLARQLAPAAATP